MTIPARLIQTQQVHFIRKTVLFSDHGKTINIGAVPAGSVIHKPMSGVFVNTVFNGTAPQNIGIGTSASTSLYGSALTLSATTFVPCAQAVDNQVYADTYIAIVVNCSASTAGQAEVVVCYIPDIDG
jgi:hypothetical protein